jgi:hypothetical protein
MSMTRPRLDQESLDSEKNLSSPKRKEIFR